MIVGLLFIPGVYVGFCPIKKWYIANSCNMGTRGLPDII